MRRSTVNSIGDNLGKMVAVRDGSSRRVVNLHIPNRQPRMNEQMVLMGRDILIRKPRFQNQLRGGLKVSRWLLVPANTVSWPTATQPSVQEQPQRWHGTHCARHGRRTPMQGRATHTPDRAHSPFCSVPALLYAVALSSDALAVSALTE